MYITVDFVLKTDSDERASVPVAQTSSDVSAMLLYHCEGQPFKSSATAKGSALFKKN
jgi:hypothetical protein